MRIQSLLKICLLGSTLLSLFIPASWCSEPWARQVAIVLDEGADDREVRIAEVLRARIQARSGALPEIRRTAEAPLDLTIHLGKTGRGGRIDSLCQDMAIQLPGGETPHPEGYAVKFEDRTLVAVGADTRGLLYAVGEILRRIETGPEGIRCPDMDVSTAPAYRFRGFSANQGGTMMKITGARPWTEKEWQTYTLDLALAGANCFYAGGEALSFIKGFELMAETGCRPNELRDHPKEWQATEMGGWVCPSIPEARAALLARWQEELPKREGYDVFRLFAGDPGGCRCKRCVPWGKTFIELSEEIANIWLKDHPGSVVLVANQDLTNEGDQAIFEYLNGKPRPWLYGIAYGPGSNAMSSYFRPELREDLFVYPGTGPVNRYLAETLHQLPGDQRIVHYSDITHWISSQYQVEHPDPSIARVYGRRTFHARPKAYYRIFQSIMPFSEGDIIYSEGYHDEFHQYLWNRLLWDPNRSLDDVMMEYCRLYFGEASADLMRQALLQLEDNLEAPLEGNPGIDRYFLLVKEAGWRMPSGLMETNHRWRSHMQKACLDKYLQLKLQGGSRQEERVLSCLRESLSTRDAAAGLSQATRILEEPEESIEMASLKEEARRLGEESDRLYGVRSEGFFRLDKPLTSGSWTRRLLEEATRASEEDRVHLLQRLAFYEDPGDGGFYDDAGSPGNQPHLVRGSSYDATDLLDPSNRPSQNTIAYTLNESQGVAFRYEDLDPKASYRVRISVAMPRLTRDILDGPTPLRKESLKVDGETLVSEIEISSFTAEEFEYDIPRHATKDGEIELSFEKAEGGIGTVVSDLWLLKR